MRAIVAGAILEAHQGGRPLRVLVSASTFKAIDNVLVGVARDLQAIVGNACPVYRLRSRDEAPPNASGFGACILFGRQNCRRWHLRVVKVMNRSPCDIL